MLKKTKLRKQKTYKYITITIFLIITLILSFLYLKEENIKEEIKKNNLIKKQEELLLKQEKSKRTKELEKRIMQEIKSVLELFGTPSGSIKTKMVGGFITYTRPKNVETDFLTQVKQEILFVHVEDELFFNFYH